MTDHLKVQILEEKNRKLESDLLQLQKLVKKLEQQRDEIYWEYESIRYAMNEQQADVNLANSGLK